MKPLITIVVADDRLPQYIGASVSLTALTLLVGAGAHTILGPLEAATAVFLGLASGLAIAERGVRLHREIAAARKRLHVLRQLLPSGVEAEPGRLVLNARYTGEVLPRSFSRSISFKPTGSPTVIDEDTVAGWRPRYTLVTNGHIGVLEADAYRLKLEAMHAYITVLHGGIETRVNRDRLTVRRGTDYAEAILEPENHLLSIVVSHVGRASGALLELEVLTPLPMRLRLAYVRGKARRVITRFAPYNTRIVMFPGSVTPGDVSSALGEKTAIMGHGVEARLRLVLKRGLRRLDSDEAVVRTVHAA